MMPAGLEYVNSWVDVDRTVCFQLMKTEDDALLKEWMEKWSDLVDFEIVPVVLSSQMQQTMAATQQMDCRQDEAVDK
jgi:NAD(P)H-flavin reductase